MHVYLLYYFLVDVFIYTYFLYTSVVALLCAVFGFYIDSNVFWIDKIDYWHVWKFISFYFVTN